MSNNNLHKKPNKVKFSLKQTLKNNKTKCNRELIKHKNIDYYVIKQLTNKNH